MPPDRDAERFRLYQLHTALQDLDHYAQDVPLPTAVDDNWLSWWYRVRACLVRIFCLRLIAADTPPRNNMRLIGPLGPFLTTWCCRPGSTAPSVTA